jgi:anti-sigma B factor antagonist
VTNKNPIKAKHLALTASRDDHTLTIEVSGEIDIANAELFADQLRRAEKSDASRIIVDLAGLTFIDSVGLTQLLIAQRRSDADSDRLRLRNLRGQPAKVVALMHLDKALRVERKT